jgi:putative flippase GtrA
MSSLAPPTRSTSENTQAGAPTLIVRRLRLPPGIRRISRYLLTSGVSTVVSEVTLIAVLAVRLLPAPAAAMAATVTGGMVSYALSRYWIWADADRRRAGLQLMLYWAVAAAGMLLAAAATDLMADHATGSHPARVAEAAAAYLATYGLLWIAKFLVYQRVIFRPAGVPDPA